MFSLVILAICSMAKGNVGSLRKRSLINNRIPSRQIPAYPLDRFQEWRNLKEEEQEIVADILDYDKKSWNLPGKSELELLDFFTINQTSFDDGTVAVGKKANLETPIDVIMNVLNITEEDIWDCHINHYRFWDWDELVNDSLATYYETLGWTNESFSNEDWDVPPSEEKEWFELTEEEREAAEYLCYFPELWAGDVEIPDWVFQPSELVHGPSNVPGPPSNVPGKNATNVTRPTIEYWDLPIVRLTVWADLTPAQQRHATTLGYNETTWDNPGTAEVETSYIRWETLTAGNQTAAEALGINEFYWDCLIQHYDNYKWTELEAQGVKVYYEALNWDYPSWHGIIAPPSSATKTFQQLGAGQKRAAKQLCFLPELYPNGTLSDVNLAALSKP